MIAPIPQLLNVIASESVRNQTDDPLPKGVAAGVTYRLFTKDLPPQPSPATAAYFVTVLVALGALLHLMPGTGLVPR